MAISPIIQTICLIAIQSICLIIMGILYLLERIAHEKTKKELAELKPNSEKPSDLYYGGNNE